MKKKGICGRSRSGKKICAKESMSSMLSQGNKEGEYFKTGSKRSKIGKALRNR